MSQVGLKAHNARSRLRVSGGTVAVSWSPIDDNSRDSFALIITMRSVHGGLHWSTAPIQLIPSSPVNIDVAGLARAVGDSSVQITAQLCGLLTRTPKGWKVAETATVLADVGSTADEERLANLCHQLSLSLPSGSLYTSLLLGDERTGKLSIIVERIIWSLCSHYIHVLTLTEFNIYTDINVYVAIASLQVSTVS